MEKEELLQYVKDSKTIKEVIEKMGIDNYQVGYNKFQRNIKKYNIDISHFLSKKEFMLDKFNSGKLKRTPIDLILIENSPYQRCTAKRRIISEKLIEYKCVFCGNEGEWMGKKLSLILDHKNGVNNDHRLENLRFVCPNCNGILETHCTGSKGYLKEERKNERIQYRAFKLRQPRLERRKVVRPDMDVVIKQVNELGYVKTGKLYGVSDNAIRKWLKNCPVV